MADNAWGFDFAALASRIPPPPPPPPFAFLCFPPDEDGPVKPVRLESLTREEVAAYRTASTTDSPPSTKPPPAQAHILRLDLSGNLAANRACVYFGTWTVPGQQSSLDIVVKSYALPEYCDYVLNELDTYIAIAHLGPIVPTLHCVLKAPTQAWAGLLLEDAGDPLESQSGADGWENLDLPRHEKLQLYNILKQLHKAGITHGDVAPRHVLRRPDGSFCFIDFEKSQRGHRCAGSTCQELAQFRKDLGV